MGSDIRTVNLTLTPAVWYWNTIHPVWLPLPVLVLPAQALHTPALGNEGP